LVRDVTARNDLARITLAIVFILTLLGLCIWITRPFLPAVAWAMTLVIATWPIMLRLQARLWNRRGLAVAGMTIGLLLILVVPLSLAISTIVANSDEIVRIAGAAGSFVIPPAPAWLGDVPMIGPRLAQRWQELADGGAHDLLQRFRPYAGAVTGWFVGTVGGIGTLILQFLLTVAVAALFYARGERAGAYVIEFGARLAGDRGRQVIILAGKAIRGVALGVVVTAFIQTAISAVILLLTGVPYASILSAVILLLCMAQLGPVLILVPAIAWMYWSGQPVAATVLLVLSIPTLAIDNVLRPILIRKGVDLPLVLILVGVIGGLVAFGLIGLFLGPTVLAVGYTLLDAWIAEGPAAEETEVEPVSG
jgi:predicted PurR-regulated permease PerM